MAFKWKKIWKLKNPRRTQKGLGYLSSKEYLKKFRNSQEKSVHIIELSTKLFEFTGSLLCQKILYRFEMASEKAWGIKVRKN